MRNVIAALLLIPELAGIVLLLRLRSSGTFHKARPLIGLMAVGYVLIFLLIWPYF